MVTINLAARTDAIGPPAEHQSSGVTELSRAESWGRPLCPDLTVDQGDPFLVEVPADERHGGFRYYVYVSAVGFPVYGCDDLFDASSWQRVGDSYPGIGVQPWAWAPCVRYVAGLERPWVMLYSRAIGAGEPEGHQGHTIRRADSQSPSGPFADSGEALTDGMDFAIDPDLFLTSDGNLEMFFASDFVSDEPFGTGILAASISTDLRVLEGTAQVVARPHSEWQVFDATRSMPWKQITGVDWDRGDTVRWSTIEGPAALRTPAGRELVLYSGGNFTDFYGIGILGRTPEGWVDLSPTPEQCLMAPDPSAGIYGPGHCSVLQNDQLGTVICYHFRQAPELARQFTVAPLRWDAESDLPYLASAQRSGRS